MAGIEWPSGSERLKQKQARDAEAVKATHAKAQASARANPGRIPPPRRSGPMFERGAGRGRGK
jgi:hypothetical protein